MGKITAITGQKKNKKRFNIFIDGEYVCSLDKMTALSFSLKEGVVIDEEGLKALIYDSEQKRAFDIAVKYICIRMRTRAELERYLSNKGFDQRVVSSTLNKLIEYKYINDEAFTKAYIASYHNKYGSKKLGFELQRLGISQEIIDIFLRDFNKEDECLSCERVAEKYAKSHQKKLTYQKLSTYLYSKGFDGEMAKGVAKKVVASFNDSNSEHNNDAHTGFDDC